MPRSKPIQTVSFFEMKGVLSDRRFWSVSLFSLLFWYLLDSQAKTEAEQELLGENLPLLPLQISFGSVILVAGILIGARAVSSKRESGGIKYLLSFPITRSELLLGIVAGRALSLFVAQMVAFATALAYILVVYGPPQVWSTTIFIMIVGIYSIVTVSMGVFASSIVRKSAAATTIGIVLLLLTMLWTVLARQLYTGVTGRLVSTSQPPDDPLLFGLVRLFPRDAFFVATNWAMGAANVAGAAYLAIPEESPARIVADYTFSGSVPIYLEPWFGVVILAAWIPMTLGPALVVFERRDVS